MKNLKYNPIYGLITTVCREKPHLCNFYMIMKFLSHFGLIVNMPVVFEELLELKLIQKKSEGNCFLTPIGIDYSKEKDINLIIQELKHIEGFKTEKVKSFF